jgi:hypothetical protein
LILNLAQIGITFNRTGDPLLWPCGKPQQHYGFRRCHTVFHCLVRTDKVGSGNPVWRAPEIAPSLILISSFSGDRESRGSALSRFLQFTTQLRPGDTDLAVWLTSGSSQIGPPVASRDPCCITGGRLVQSDPYEAQQVAKPTAKGDAKPNRAAENQAALNPSWAVKTLDQSSHRITLFSIMSLHSLFRTLH